MLGGSRDPLLLGRLWWRLPGFTPVVDTPVCSEILYQPVLANKLKEGVQNLLLVMHPSRRVSQAPARVGDLSVTALPTRDTLAHSSS